MQSYIIPTNTNNDPLIIDEYSINNKTSLGLIGQHRLYHGELFQSNILHILEHFSSPYPPNNPLDGQVWYDNKNKEIKYFYSGEWHPLPVISQEVDAILKSNDSTKYLTVPKWPTDKQSVSNKSYVDSWLYEWPKPTNNSYMSGVKYEDGYFVGWGNVDYTNRVSVTEYTKRVEASSGFMRLWAVSNDIHISTIAGFTDGTDQVYTPGASFHVFRYDRRGLGGALTDLTNSPELQSQYVISFTEARLTAAVLYSDLRGKALIDAEWKKYSGDIYFEVLRGDSWSVIPKSYILENSLKDIDPVTGDPDVVNTMQYEPDNRRWSIKLSAVAGVNDIRIVARYGGVVSYTSYNSGSMCSMRVIGSGKLVGVHCIDQADRLLNLFELVFQMDPKTTVGDPLVKFPKQMKNTNYSVIANYIDYVNTQPVSKQSSFTVSKWNFTDNSTPLPYDEQNIPQNAIWSLLPNRSGLKVFCTKDFRYVAGATANIKCDNDCTVKIKITGMAEPGDSGYELMSITVNGALYGSATSPGPGDYQSGAAVLHDIDFINNYPTGMNLSAGEHAIAVTFDTGDENYNEGAWYQFEFIYDSVVGSTQIDLHEHITVYDKTVNSFKIKSTVPFEKINFVAMGFMTDEISVIAIDDEDEIVEGKFNKTISGNLLKAGNYTISKISYAVSGVSNTVAISKTKNEIILTDVGVFNFSDVGGWSFTPDSTFSGPVPQISYVVTDGISTKTSTLTISDIEDTGIYDEDEDVVAVEGENSYNLFQNLNKIEDFEYTITSVNINGKTHQITSGGNIDVNITGGRANIKSDGNIKINIVKTFSGSTTFDYIISNGITQKSSTFTASVAGPAPAYTPTYTPPQQTYTPQTSTPPQVIVPPPPPPVIIPTGVDKFRLTTEPDK